MPGKVFFCSFRERQKVLLLKYHRIVLILDFFASNIYVMNSVLLNVSQSNNQTDLPQKVYCLRHVLLSFSDFRASQIMKEKIPKLTHINKVMNFSALNLTNLQIDDL